ncbi:MAG TPA: PIG-L deacetylase family protein [Candidatus Sulfotelmatobacter sp.]|jgi:LmbE family N-acetylglucosaminyl deacetylase|nr:PIG-L deacetylase family protein [Candidatus Sulfotelmatobacter sp.]
MTVLIVAAHPDDEVLGCGGTMARLAAEGEAVHVLIMAEGATSRDDNRDSSARAEELETLRDAARASAAVLGAHPPRFASLPDNRMDGLERLDIIKIVEKIVLELCPHTIYTHHGNDLNIDHRLTHEAVLTACRPLPGASVVAIHAFETLSSSEWAATQQGRAFQPTRFVGIGRFLSAKLRALEAYNSEMRPFPHARSIEAVESLARLRGAMVGLPAAEAFQTVRQVIL